MSEKKRRDDPAFRVAEKAADARQVNPRLVIEPLKSDAANPVPLSQLLRDRR